VRVDLNQFALNLPRFPAKKTAIALQKTAEIGAFYPFPAIGNLINFMANSPLNF
jgi:hypothetical protein